MNKRNHVDPAFFWVVVAELEGKFDVHTFDRMDQATDFSTEPTKGRKSPPISLARSPLEQSAPLFRAAAQTILLAVTAYTQAPAERGHLHAAADFLQSVCEYADMDIHVQDFYRETRKMLLFGRPQPEPTATVVESLRPHLELCRTLR